MSGLAKAFDEALERAGSGTVHVDHDGAKATVDVVDSDRIGVRVRRVHVERAHDRDPLEVAADYERGLRPLPERVEPVEVDASLGGATLRTRPDELRDGEFFEVQVRGTRDTDVQRYKAEPGQPREAVDWTLSRDQLGRLVDELAK